MPRPRSPKSNLFRLLESALQPIYVLADDQSILFANESLARWLGVDVDQVIGRVCEGTGKPPADPIDALVRGLAAEPGQGGREEFEQIVFCSAPGNPLRRSSARFQRLQTTDGSLGWLVVLGAGGLGESPSAATTLAAQLAILAHELLPGQPPATVIGRSVVARRLLLQVDAAIEARRGATIFGPAGSEPEVLARYIFSRFPGADQLELAPIRANQADQVTIQETIRRLSRMAHGQRSPRNDDYGQWLLLLDADRLEPAAAMELNGFLELPNNQIRILATADTAVEHWPICGDLPTILRARLTAVEIGLPALAERREDVPLMFQALLEDLAREQSEPVPTLAPAAIEMLLEYSWPGNLTELRNAARGVIKGFSAAGGRRTVNPEDLPERLRLAIKHGRLGRAPVESIDLETRLAAIEREFIERALGQARYNRAQAAKLLGISRAKLLRRCEQLSIELPNQTIAFEIVEEPESIEKVDFQESDE